MPRLVNAVTGVVVVVDEATAASLGAEWQKPTPPAEKRPPGRPRKT